MKEYDETTHVPVERGALPWQLVERGPYGVAPYIRTLRALNSILPEDERIALAVAQCALEAACLAYEEEEAR